jgi:FKBP-type peptidyl-prolyl cis-trans isomerase
MKKLVVCLLAFVSATGIVNAQAKKAPATKPTGTGTTPKPVMKNLMDSFSYAVGVNIANNMKSQGINELNYDLMAKGLEDIFKDKTTALTAEQCNASLQTQMGIFSKKKEEENKKQNAAEKAKGAAFLATNKTRPGVITLPDGLQYEILQQGENGPKPTEQDTVVVDYAGTLIDGREFDASRGKPITYPVSGFVRGWVEILQLMTKGARYKVYIPSELGYGETGSGGGAVPIPGGATLIFELTLIDIKPAAVK